MKMRGVDKQIAKPDKSKTSAIQASFRFEMAAYWDLYDEKKTDNFYRITGKDPVFQRGRGAKLIF